MAPMLGLSPAKAQEATPPGPAMPFRTGIPATGRRNIGGEQGRASKGAGAPDLLTQPLPLTASGKAKSAAGPDEIGHFRRARLANSISRD